MLWMELGTKLTEVYAQMNDFVWIMVDDKDGIWEGPFTDAALEDVRDDFKDLFDYDKNIKWKFYVTVNINDDEMREIYPLDKVPTIKKLKELIKDAVYKSVDCSLFKNS